jgi:ankyrin repeat protein
MKIRILFLIIFTATFHIAFTAKNTKETANTALFEAISANHENTVATLLKEGVADTNASGRCRKRPLHVAAEVGNLTTVVALCKHKASLVAIDFRRRQPLFTAAIHERLAIVAYLLLLGANPLAVDNIGQTAQDVVRQMIATGNCKDRETCSAIATLLAVAEINWLASGN